MLFRSLVRTACEFLELLVHARIREQACGLDPLDAAAKSLDLGVSIQWIKAAGLLTDASVHQQFEKFTSCADKARRARIYIGEAQK